MPCSASAIECSSFWPSWPVSVVIAGMPRASAVWSTNFVASGDAIRPVSITMWSRPKASAIPRVAASSRASPVTGM